eukprot:876268-Prorocentrum_minimum.AAC.1
MHNCTSAVYKGKYTNNHHYAIDASDHKRKRTIVRLYAGIIVSHRISSSAPIVYLSGSRTVSAQLIPTAGRRDRGCASAQMHSIE